MCMGCCFLVSDCSFIIILSYVAAGESNKQWLLPISVNRDLWKLHLFIIMWESLLWAERRNSVLFSDCCLILIACAYFLSGDCTICYTFWDKNIIEIEHTNFNQAAFFVNRVVKLIATIQPCPGKISIHTHTHQAPHTHAHIDAHTYSLTNTPGRT